MTLPVQVAALLERVARSPLPAYHTVPAFVARRIYRDTRAALAPQPPAIAEARLVVVGGKVALRAYRPVLEETLPAFVPPRWTTAFLPRNTSGRTQTL